MMFKTTEKYKDGKKESKDRKKEKKSNP